MTHECEPERLEPTAAELVRAAIEHIDRAYQPGAIQWADAKRPDLIRIAEQATARLDGAYKSQRLASVQTACVGFIGAWKAVAAAYAVEAKRAQQAA